MGKMRCYVPTSEYDPQTIMYPLICTHHRLHCTYMIETKSQCSLDTYATDNRIWWRNDIVHRITERSDDNGKFSSWRLFHIGISLCDAITIIFVRMHWHLNVSTSVQKIKNIEWMPLFCSRCRLPAQYYPCSIFFILRHSKIVSWCCHQKNAFFPVTHSVLC